ncbi:MAG: hypothetical protein JXA20_16470 [Spirochaetes bacterium]|nr:hypothetical protein [Spirochaetota bacterium]
MKKLALWVMMLLCLPALLWARTGMARVASDAASGDSMILCQDSSDTDDGDDQNDDGGDDYNDDSSDDGGDDGSDLDMNGDFDDEIEE